MNRPHTSHDRGAAVAPAAGLGVPCCEAQADGVPCSELGIPCEICGRVTHRAPPTAPPLDLADYPDVMSDA